MSLERKSDDLLYQLSHSASTRFRWRVPRLRKPAPDCVREIRMCGPHDRDGLWLDPAGRVHHELHEDAALHEGRPQRGGVRGTRVVRGTTSRSTCCMECT